MNQATGDAPYSITVDGLSDDYFVVRRFKGRETISEVYSFELVVTGPAKADDEVERVALGQAATLIWNVGKTPRAFYGVIAAVRVVEARSIDARVEYVLRFVPRLWQLKRKRNTRIFQNMRVPDVVTAVLLDSGISARWQLTSAYPVREYCTQYEESDYAFIKRILAEAGIFFYFPQGGPMSSAEHTAASIVSSAGAPAASAVGSLAGAGVGNLVGAAASAAAPVIPGDTLIGSDDASFYPGIGNDDLAALEAATIAEAAPEIGEAVGGLGGVGDAVVGGASAVAGDVIAAVTSSPAPTLYYLSLLGATLSRLDKVASFSLRTTSRANSATFRDYDPDRPMAKLESVSMSEAPFPPSALEAAAEAATTAGSAVSNLAPGPVGDVGAAVAENAGAVATGIESVAGDHPPPLLSVYEHHGNYLFPKWAFADDEAARMLRQRRRRTAIGRGTSGCPDLAAAHKFALSDYPIDHLDQPYVVTTVEHRGIASPIDSEGGEWRLYENAFECAPASMSYVPPRPKRKSVQVSLTARVVGPPGAEIYSNPSGQIKVQFQWDRLGKNDDKSSCWIRTMHAWGGAGWGAQFIPRVGMEVVVVFEGGDPDKPMVIGSLYNGTHPTPFALPADQTRSGWRTQTTPGGGGFNELSFEDKAGGEQIYLHASRDHLEKIEQSQTVGVGADQSITVGLDRIIEVARNESHTVHGDVRHETVGAHRVTHGSAETTIHENAIVNVGGKLVQSATERSMLSIGDHYLVKVAGDLTFVVGENDPQRGAVAAQSKRSFTISSEDTVRLLGSKKIEFQCGDSSITLTPEGVQIKGKSIVLDGGSLSAMGSGPALHLTDDVEIVAAGSVRILTKTSSMVLDANASIKGTAIKLNCDEQFDPASDGTAAPDETKPFKVTVSDPDFKPYSGKTYVLVAGEKRFTGTVGGDGSVQQSIPKTASSADLTIWEDEYPTGPRRHWAITIADELPPASDVAGAELRLSNLGYRPGKSESLTALAPATAAALSEFQTDHQLPATGALDGPTIAKLTSAHGS